MSETTSSRLLTLLSLLQGRRDWPGQELADRLEVSGRTVRRDVDRLRELGYPVESLTGPAGGYRLRGRHRDAAAAARRRRGDRDRGRPAHGRARVGGRDRGDVGARAGQARAGAARPPAPARPGARRRDHDAAYGGGPTVDPQVPDAARRRLPRPRAACASATRRARASARAARPSRTRSSTSAAAGTSWRGTAGARTGARSASTASRARTPSGRFQPRELPAEDAATFVSQVAAGAAQPLRGAAHAARLGGGDAQARAALGGPFEPLGEERCEYRTGDDNLDWLAVRIAMLGVEFEVHEPPELIEHLQALAARLARAAQPA